MLHKSFQPMSAATSRPLTPLLLKGGYEQFTNSTQIAGYSVTRIDNCSGNEGVSDGIIPQGESGYNAISQDMIAGCIKRH